MTADERDILIETMCEVLEKLAYMFGEPAEDDPVKTPAEGYLGSIKFVGHRDGELCVAVPYEMCLELSANMLGTELGDPKAEEDAGDALKELLNVSCGNILTALYGTHPTFELSVPEARKTGAEAWEKLAAHPESIRITIDDYPALVNFQARTETPVP